MRTMAYTQADLDALDAAIVRGVTTVTMNGRSVTYRTMSDLMTARNHVARQIAASSGQRGARYSTADFSD